MEWNFTPEDVVKAKVSYELDEFIKDFRNEVAVNISDNHADNMHSITALLYDLCHWCATERDPEQFYAEELAPEDLLDVNELRAMHLHLAENITMLGAILQRMIMNQIDKGLELERALNKVTQQHQKIVEQLLA